MSYSSDDGDEAESEDESPFAAYAVKAGAQIQEEFESLKQSDVDSEERTIAEIQQADPDIGPILRLKLQSEDQPPIETLLRESAEVLSLIHI